MIGRRLIIQFLLFLTGVTFAQSPKEDIQSILDNSEIDSLLLFVRELSGDTSTVINGIVTTIASRHSEQAGNDKAQQYIAAKLSSYGLDVTVQNYSFALVSSELLLIGEVPYSFTTEREAETVLTLERYLTRMPDGSFSPEMVQSDDYLQESSVGKNVIGVQIGSAYPEKSVILCAHYDCQPNEVIAPGADDNASGTAAVLEAARIFSQYAFPFTIVYALWDEEEQGLIGSHYYANVAREAGDDILGVINLDMIAWDSNSDSHIDIHTYPIANSEQIATLMTRMNSIFSLGLEIETVNPGTGASDHASFWDNEYGAVLLIEDFDEFNSYYHTPEDRVEHFNTTYYEKAAKLSYATLGWLAMDLGIYISHVPQAQVDNTEDIELSAVVESILPIGGGVGGPGLYYRASTGSSFSDFERVAGNWIGTSDTCSFIIPGQSTGTIIDYYLAAQDSDSTTVQTLPDGGKGFNPPGNIPPPEFYRFYVGTDDLVLFDDLSIFENWSTTGTWDITYKKYSSPPSSLTDTPNRYYGTNETNIITLIDTIDLSGFGGASLEFETQWHIEEDMDYGDVQVSPNGIEWHSMPGIYTEPGSGTFQPNGSSVYDGVQRDWVHEYIDLSDFFGEKIVLRFLLNTNGSVNGDGWYIDDIMIRGAGLIDTDPQIFVRIDTLDFGQTFVDYTDSLELVIKNRGLLDLIISGVASDPAEYSVQPSTATITPGGSKVFIIFFTPTTAADYSGTITFSSNDPDEGTFILPLCGQGVLPPVISVVPDSLSATLNTGETTTQTLTITNTGASTLASDLVFNVTADYLGGSDGNNYALFLDGEDDYIEIPDDQTLQISSQLTLEAWIKFEEGGSYQPRLISKGPDGDGYELLMTGTGSERYLELRIGPGEVGSNALLHAGEWYHVAAKYDGSQIFLLINGIEDISGPFSGPLNISDLNLFIGQKSTSAWDKYRGLIDEVRIWNVARTHAEIQTYMNRQIYDEQPGLVGYWTFNEGTGSSTYDQTSNDNDGTLYGGATWAISTPSIITWLYITPLSGMVPPGTSSELNITFRVQDFMDGSYNSVVKIASNDPASPLIVIPVSVVATSSEVTENQVLPQSFALHQNYPNPFNPITTINYDLPEDGQIKLVLYNIMGHQVIKLVHENQQAGYKSIRWNGRNTSGQVVSAGMYFYAIETNGHSAIRKMVLLK